MRCRWKRGRPSCRKFLCFTCIVVFIIIVYTFINEEGSRFEKQWSCEELRAKELLIELVSSRVCPFVTRGINSSTISVVFYVFIQDTFAVASKRGAEEPASPELNFELFQVFVRGFTLKS